MEILEQKIELVPNQSSLAKPLFNTREEYEAFRIDWYNETKPKLDECTRARAESELEARRHIVY